MNVSTPSAGVQNVGVLFATLMEAAEHVPPNIDSNTGNVSIIELDKYNRFLMKCFLEEGSPLACKFPLLVIYTCIRIMTNHDMLNNVNRTLFTIS